MAPSYHPQTLVLQAAAAGILRFEKSATEHGWRHWLSTGAESGFLKAVETFKSALDAVLDTPLGELSEADLQEVGRQVNLAVDGIEVHVAHAGENHSLALVAAIYAIRRRHEDIVRRGAGHRPPSR
jgi:hypothetical protein